MTDHAGEDETLRYAERLLVETREELARADTKAAVLLSAAGVGVAALLAGLVAGEWSPLDLPAASAALWWTGAAALATGIGMLTSAVAPRINHSKPPATATYFGHIVQLHPEQVRAAIRRTAADPLGRAIDQLIVIGHIVHRKYILIRRAILMIATAGVLTALAVGIARV
jgi:hypothetical protein